MERQQFLKKYIKPFSNLSYIFSKHFGFIVWRVGTGGNVEILHLRVFELRKGYATMLMRQMLGKIKPYYSVFVLLLASNKAARAAYKSFGFTLTKVKGLYKGGAALIGVATFQHLKKTLGV